MLPHLVADHPTSEQLAAFADGGLGLSDHEFTSIEQHLENCTDCASAMERQSNGKLAERIRAANQSSHAIQRTFNTHDWLTPLESTASEGLSDWPTLPGYDINGILGAGGMGVVYKATQLGLKRIVAIKMVLGGRVAGAHYRARFKAEAESVARLQHPNIVQIYEVGEHDGQPYCALEYVGGGTLSNALRLAHDAWKPYDCAKLVETLARAIAHAHAHGIVHRDLKPGNVLMVEGDEGRVEAEESSASATLHPPPSTLHPKVADFGLAKQLDGEDMTRTDAIVGTPSYMAPEQAGGKAKDVGPAADIWALGAILYEMLTGRPPFRGSSVAETLDWVRNQDPVAPRKLAPSCPRDLETICLKCLTKEIPGRYVSALALAEDLRRFLAGEPIEARPVSAWERFSLWCRRNPAVAGLSAALLLGSWIAVGWIVVANLNLREAVDLANYNAEEQRKASEAEKESNKLLKAEQAKVVAESRKVTEERNTAQKERNKAETEKQTAQEERARAQKSAEERRLALSRTRIIDAARAQQDGDLLSSLPWLVEALALDRDDPVREPEHRLRLGTALRLSPQLSQLLVHKGQISYVGFTPDGTKVVTASWDKTATVWDLATGKALATVTQNAPILSAAISPDGKYFATACNDQTVRVWETATGKPITDSLSLNSPAVCICFSPDGKSIAAGGGEKLKMSLYGVRYTEIFQGVGKPPLRIPVADNDLAKGRARVWDVETGKLIGRGITLDGWINHVAFSPDGLQLFVGAATQNGDGEFGSWDYRMEKAILRSKEEGTRRIWHGGFSPDGKLIIASGGSETEKRADARILDASGKIVVQMPHQGVVTAATFSPDGKVVATASHDKTAALWSVAEKKKLGILRHQGEVNGVNYSPSGDLLLTWSNDWTGRVWEARTGALVARLTHSSPVMVGAFSADEKAVVTGDSDGVVRVWKLPLAGVPIQAPRALADVEFSPDGSRLLLASGREAAVQYSDGGRYSVSRFVSISRLDLHERTEKTPTIGIDIEGADPFSGPRWMHRFSPDGRQLLTLGEREKDLKLQLIVHEVVTGKMLMGPFTPDGQILGATFTTDGRWLVATSKVTQGDRQQKTLGSSALRLWHLTENGMKPASEVLTQEGAVNGATLGAEGKYLIAVCSQPSGHSMQLWNVTEKKKEGEPLKLNGSAISLISDTEGRRVACVVRRDRVEALRTAEVLFWNAATGKSTTLLHHRDAVTHLTFHPSGKRLATASDDRTACVWDVETGAMVGQPLKHADVVCKINFSADGKYAVSASRDGTARAWVVATGEPLTPPLRHRSGVMSAAFSPDGKEILTGCADGKAYRWDVLPETRTLEELQRVVPVQASSEIDSSGNLSPLGTTALQRLWAVRSGK